MPEPGSVPIPLSRRAIVARLRQLEEYGAAMDAHDNAFQHQVDSVPLCEEMDALRGALRALGYLGAGKRAMPRDDQ